MKMFKIVFLAVVMAFFAVSVAMAAADGVACNTIQAGSITNSTGGAITTGFDVWGYNYEAHLFNGGYCEAYQNAAWCLPYADVNLEMKWNEAWLGNKDCDIDNKLDRHFGYTSYIGSGAWLTNHQSGKVDVNGKGRQWTYFVKIVAIEPEDTIVNGFVQRGGVELGPSIWGEFAIIEQISNDPSYGEHGVLYKSPVGPGLGNLN